MIADIPAFRTASEAERYFDGLCRSFSLNLRAKIEEDTVPSDERTEDVVAACIVYAELGRLQEKAEYR